MISRFLSKATDYDDKKRIYGPSKYRIEIGNRVVVVNTIVWVRYT